MWFGIVSLFPEMFAAVSHYGVTGRAVRDGLIKLEFWNPRDFTLDKHRTVDDRPYGGGPGMLMMYAPLKAAVNAAKQSVLTREESDRSSASSIQKTRVIYLSPQGRKLNQRGVEDLASYGSLILVAGRYEGIDERFIEDEVDEEWSIGDYVLSGGELAAMTLIDSIGRLVPGVLGCDISAHQDSFESNLLDCPHYTRPESIGSKDVPQVLLGGDHEKIRQWRLKQSLGRTWQRRPDLLAHKQLTAEEQRLLNEFIVNCNKGF